MFEFVNQSCASTDILILSIPFVDTHSPLCAGASLKSIAERARFSCSVVDLNILTVRFINGQKERNKFLDFFNSGYIHPTIQPLIGQYTNDVVSLVKRYNPKILGLSVFSFDSRAFAVRLCKEIKNKYPDIQIMLGGAGLTDTSSDDPNFAENLQKEQLIDHFIKGDAEHSFYEFLTGNKTYPGVNQSNWIQLKRNDLAVLPYPNYDDYYWNWYDPALPIDNHELKNVNTNNVAIPITGSRGCVRNCKFCDFIVSHKQFTWRTAENIFDEMIHQSKRYGITMFGFTDSLVNGNMKEYRQLMTMLAEYNNLQPFDKRIQWVGQFIMRPETQFKEDLWELTARAGATQLFIGIETIDDKVRYDMGKAFTNKDIDFGLSMMKKYNINAYLMFAIGYVSETQEVHDRWPQWLQQRVEYKDNITIGIMGTMEIPKDTYLDLHHEQLGIVWSGKKAMSNWATADNKNTFDKRNEWAKLAYQHVVDFGFNGDSNRIPHHQKDL